MKKYDLIKNLSFHLLPILIFTLIFIVTLPVMAQTNDTSKSPYSFSSNKFSSETLGMTVKAPDGWMILPTLSLMENLSAYSGDEIEKLEEMKKGLDKNKDAKKIKEIEKSIKDLKEARKTQEQTKASSDGILSLFNATLSKGNTTCIVTAKAIKLDLIDGISTGKDYLKVMQPPTKKQGTAPKLNAINLGGITFDSSVTKIKMVNGKIKKNETLTYRTYATPMKGFMLIISSAASAGNEKSVNQFMKAIKFK